jgi:hypothetical protein
MVCCSAAGSAAQKPAKSGRAQSLCRQRAGFFDCVDPQGSVALPQRLARRQPNACLSDNMLKNMTFIEDRRR